MITALAPQLSAAAVERLSHSLNIRDVWPERGPVPPIPDPGPLKVASSLANLLSAVALNPQPLPPRDGAGASQGATKFLDNDWCGTVPHRFPWPPPPPPFGLDSIHPAVSGLVNASFTR